MKKHFLTLLCFISIHIMGQNIPMGLMPDFIDYETCSDTNNFPQDIVSIGGCQPVSNNGRSYDSKFIPLITQPIIYVRTNFIFLQREDGTGNFQENNPEHQSIINEIISKMNSVYSNLSNPNSLSCYTGSDFIQDARIQFLVNKIYVRDNYGWNNRHDFQSIKCPEAYPSWYLDYLDGQVVNNPAIPRGINIYFTEDSINYRNLVEMQNTTTYKGASYACSQFPSTNNYLRTSKIHMPDVYSKYWLMKNIVPNVYNQPWEPIVKSWEVDGLGATLAHEIGHSLWLYHESPYYGNGACYYSLMNPAGAAPHNYLPPTEIGRIYAALSLTNLRSFVPSDTYLGIKQISTVETWINMRLYNSINITQTGNITLTCDIIMPYQSNIEINGILTINSSNIHSIQNGWNGIVVKSGGLLILNTTDISDYNIVVENGGTIQIKGSLTMSGNHNITVQSGGYLCVESGTSIQLTDYNSVIKMSNGALNGVNPSLSVTSNCISNPIAATIIGSGSIVDYSQDVYIQNIVINTNRYIGGKNIYVGNHVTTSQTQGDVLINNSSNVIFDGKNVTFDAGFECASGSTYETIIH